MSCINFPAGQFSDGTSTPSACGSGTFYNAANNACEGCPTGKVCDATTGGQSVCQVGWYIDDTGLVPVCDPCEAGRYCEDGIDRSSNNAAPFFSKAKYPEAITCFPGYSCSATSDTGVCGAGEWAGPTHDASFTWTDRSGRTCEEKDWLHQSDLPGQDCPEESFRETDRLRCEISGIDTSLTTPSTNTPCELTASEFSWYGEECKTCPAIDEGDTSLVAADFSTHSCNAMDVYHDLKCEPGTLYSAGVCELKSDTKDY